MKKIGADHTVRHVALLRGLNLGPNNRLPIKDLAGMFSKAGCRDVATYIQSGNVVFSATPTLAAGLAGQIQQRITEAFGFNVPVVLRTAAEMARVAANNPFLDAGADEKMLHVMFLADEPATEQVKALDPARSAPDAFAVRGREIFLHLPNGGARSKLTNAYFDGRLKTVSTVRNWRTVLALFEMLKGSSKAIG